MLERQRLKTVRVDITSCQQGGYTMNKIVKTRHNYHLLKEKDIKEITRLLREYASPSYVSDLVFSVRRRLHPERREKVYP